MIKFRAWDNENGFYLYNVQDAYDMSGSIKYDDGEYADYDEDCFGDFLNNKRRYDVEQFTGLKDVNGNEIYENDLVRLTDDLEDPIYKVIFDEAKFEIIGGGVCYDLGEEFMDCEVIGNVHENPELLEADTND